MAVNSLLRVLQPWPRKWVIYTNARFYGDGPVTVGYGFGRVLHDHRRSPCPGTCGAITGTMCADHTRRMLGDEDRGQVLLEAMWEVDAMLPHTPPIAPRLDLRRLVPPDAESGEVWPPRFVQTSRPGPSFTPGPRTLPPKPMPTRAPGPGIKCSR